MLVEIIPKLGGAPIRIEATLVTVLTDDGTPVAISGSFGAAGGIKTAHVNDKDFPQTLRGFGHGEHRVVIDRISTPPPPGATLLRGRG